MPAPSRSRATLSSSLACAALVAALATTPSRAQACRCAPQTAQEAYDSAVAVFEGFVQEVGAPASDPPGSAQRRKVRMEVVSAWKGAEGEEVTVLTAGDSAGCGYSFKAGQGYLVYASASGGGLEVNLCSRTRPMAEASEDLERLGMGSTPVDPKAKPPVDPSPAVKDEPPARGGCAGCTIANSAMTGGTASWMAAIAIAIGARVCARRRR
jgi:Tissue inhibitor of metalloproteinase